MFGEYCFTEIHVGFVLIIIGFIIAAFSLVMNIMKGSAFLKNTWYEVKEENNEAVDPAKVEAGKKKFEKFNRIKKISYAAAIALMLLGIFMFSLSSKKIDAVDCAKDTDFGSAIEAYVDDVKWYSSERSNNTKYVIAKFKTATGTRAEQYFEYYYDDDYIYVEVSDLILDGEIATYDSTMWFYSDLEYTADDPYYYD